MTDTGGSSIKLALRIVPVTMAEAKSFVAKHHRHNKPPLGAVFVVGVASEDGIVGVAIAGRPIARMLQDGLTLEVNRCCTLGVVNACSMLYGACRRAAKALGWMRLITYTLASESGASLRAAGFVKAADVPESATWSVPSRPRMQTNMFGEEMRPSGPKQRWEWQLREATEPQP